MNKRITFNVVLAYLHVAILAVRDFIRLDILQDHSIYAGSWLAYMMLEPLVTFVISPLIFLIVVLLPYNLILYKLGVETLSLWKKSGIFFLILVVFLAIAGSVTNVFMPTWWENYPYLIFFIIYSIIFPLIIHFRIDRRRNY